MLSATTTRDGQNGGATEPRSWLQRASAAAWSVPAFSAIVFGASSLIFFGNLGSTPLFNPDEAYYAEPAREMVESGNYLITYLNYAVRHTKPPLGIWAMAGCDQLFGANEFAARFFGAACASILVCCTALFARKYAGNRVAVLSTVILLSSPLFLGVGREAIVDMPLALFIATALMSFFHAKMQNQPRWIWVGYGLLGLSVMTKGPVGLVLPVAVLSVFYFLRGELKSALAFFKPWLGLLLTAFIAVPWFAAVIYKTNGAYYREFIVRENFQRFTSVVDHKAPWWYHIAAMFGGMLPWTVFLPSACFAGIKNLSAPTAVAPSAGTIVDPKGQTKISAVLSRLRTLDARGSMLLFSACSAVTILAFFSASVSKLLPYTVPAFPALAILLAAFIDNQLNSESSKQQNADQEREKLNPLTTGFAILAVAYGAGMLIAPHAIAKLRDCPPGLGGVISGALGTMCAGSVIALIASGLKRSGLALVVFATMLIAATTIFGSQAVTSLSEHWEEPIRAYSQFAAGSNWPIVVFQARKPSVTFYAHRKVLYTDDKADLFKAMQSSEHGYVISRTKSGDILKQLGLKTIQSKGTTVLARWDRAE